MLRPRIPRELAPIDTPDWLDRFLRLAIQAFLVVATVYVVAQLVTNPTKRLVQLAVAIVAVAIGYRVRPVVALCCGIIFIPFSLHTSVATTTTLLVYAIAVLMIVKVKPYQLGSPFVFPQVDTAVAALVFMMLISLTQLDTEYLPDAFARLREFLAALLLYYMVIMVVRTRHDLEIVLKASMTVAGVVGVIGTLQTLFPHREWLPSFFKFANQVGQMEGAERGQVRVFATFPGISSFGEYIGTSVLITYVLFRQTRNLAAKAYWIGIIVLLLVALAGSATRMGVIILAFGFVYMLVMGRGAIPREQLLGVIGITLIIGVLAAGFISPLTDQMVDRLESLGSDDSSVQSRWGVMEQALDRIPDSPWLGHGLFIPPGTFRGHVSMNIHNLYLTMGYTIGIPGLLAFLWFSALVWRKSLATVQNRALPSAIREYSLVLHTSFVMFLVYQLTSDYITHSMHMHVAWLRLGLVMASHFICLRILAGEESAA